MLELRDYQVGAVEKLSQMIKESQRKIILICPTGSGKTVIASEIIRRMKEKGKKCLMLVHRDHLIEQSYEKFKAVGANITVCKSGDKRITENWDVMLATIQTLRNREPPNVDCVLVDECHLSAANTWVTTLNGFNCPIIGLTATPFRLDGRSLGAIYTSQYVASTINDLMDKGMLCPLEWYVPTVQPGKYIDAYDAWLKYANGKKTIIFANDVQHSKLIEQKFGGLARHIDAKTKKSELKKILSDFRNGHILVITNFNMVTEGYDVEDCECIILSGKTSSLALFLQKLGRGMRPHKGKNSCIILDLAGNLLEHGHPHDIDMSKSIIPANSKSYKTKSVNVTICKECFIATSKYPCHNCGFVLPLKTIQEEKIKLENAELAYPKGSLKYFIDIGRKNGYKNGWAYYKWRGGRDAPAPA